VLEGTLFQPEAWICFFVALCRPHIPCNSHEFHHRGHIGHHSIFFMVLVCQVVTCALHAPRFEMVIIFYVPISLTVCTLSNISFVFRLFEFNFALLYIFYNEYVLVIRSRFQFYKNYGRLVLYCLIFDIFVTVFPSFSISVLITS
jgi:hypothetical protein